MINRNIVKVKKGLNFLLFSFVYLISSIYYKPKKFSDILYQDRRTYRLNMTSYEWGELWTPFLIGLLAEVEALFKTKGAIEKGTERGIGEKMKQLREKMENEDYSS